MELELLCLLLLIAYSDVEGTSGPSEVRGKSTPETLEANQVDAPTTTVSKTASCSPLNCTDPMSDSIDDCPNSLTGISSSEVSVPCSELPANCLLCNFNCTCVYGEKLNVTCKAKPNVICNSSSEGGVGREVVKEMVCQFCYQTPEWQHLCTGYSKCNSVDTPRPLYTANCTVASDVVCMGRRSFLKRRQCNWTSGYHWSTALILSITLGGFGADRSSC
ncbi:hypothetical protein FHG87_011271 [Trinorchestia longiramus]|nr:hypothetical protein FHG87_011271 [Trinorchestia longiramus]